MDLPGSDFGFGALGLSAADFLEPDMIVQLGYPPQRIDIMTGADGVVFDECYPSRIILDVNGLAVPFIDLENLSRNKAAFGRSQDLADLDALTD